MLDHALLTEKYNVYLLAEHTLVFILPATFTATEHAIKYKQSLNPEGWP